MACPAVPALVVGAGAMGALSVATLSRQGVGPVSVTNRGADRAVRLAAAYDATAVPFADLAAALVRRRRGRHRDRVHRAGAHPRTVAAAAQARDLAGRTGPLVLLDLAVPRDVEPAVAGLPGVVVVDIDALGDALRGAPGATDEAAVGRIVAAEVEALRRLAARRRRRAHRGGPALPRRRGGRRPSCAGWPSAAPT